MSDFGTALIEAADAIEATIQHRRIYVYTDRQGGKVIEYAEDRSGKWCSYLRFPVQIEEIQSEIQNWIEAQTVLCHDDIVAGECSCTPWDLMRDDAALTETKERNHEV